MAETKTGCAQVSIVDGQVLLRLERKFSLGWSVDLGTKLRCPFGMDGYALFFEMRTMRMLADGSQVVESEIVDLAGVRQKGISIELPLVLQSFQRTGWTMVVE